MPGFPCVTIGMYNPGVLRLNHLRPDPVILRNLRAAGSFRAFVYKNNAAPTCPDLASKCGRARKNRPLRTRKTVDEGQKGIDATFQGIDGVRDPIDDGSTLIDEGLTGIDAGKTGIDAG